MTGALPTQRDVQEKSAIHVKNETGDHIQSTLPPIVERRFVWWRSVNTADTIICTFVIFSFIPTVVQLVAAALSSNRGKEFEYLRQTCRLLYLLGYISDAVVHSLFRPEIRRALRMRWRLWNENKKLRNELRLRR